eukprot:3773218-Amphidinium_carterae.1
MTELANDSCVSDSVEKSRGSSQWLSVVLQSWKKRKLVSRMPRVLLDVENPSEEQELEAMCMHWSRKFNHGKLLGERSAARLLDS